MLKETARFNIAIVGCGVVAGYGHAPALAKSPDWRCVAYVDKIRSRAEEFAERFGGDIYEDYRKVLDRNDIDAVAVLTLPTGHCRITLDALAAGKHVFTEKPISSDAGSAQKMIDAARCSGKKLFVGFLLRHTGVYQKMAEVIQAGMIGKPAVYRMGGFERYESCSKYPNGRDPWGRALDFIRDTSCAIDCGTHYVDLMRWYSGAEAKHVQGIGARINPDVPKSMFDWEAFQIEFDDGSRGTYETGWGYSFPGNRSWKEAIGSKGLVQVRLAVIEEGKEADWNLVFRSSDSGAREEVLCRSEGKGFEGEWAHFAKMIRENLDPSPALSDALASLRIVEAGHRSALEGRGINIGDRF